MSGETVSEAEKLRKDTLEKMLAAAPIFRPNGIAIWIMQGHGAKGPIIIPGVEHRTGDYAELIDADGQPLEHGQKRNVNYHTWWVRYCRKDSVVVWLMPFDVWSVFRDRAAEAALMGVEP